MSGTVNSFTGFLGTTGGPSVNTGNNPLSQLSTQNGLYNNSNFLDSAANYGQNGGDINSVLGKADSGQEAEAQNSLATGPLTGSRFATDQVRSNPILGSLFGDNGQFGKDLSLQNDQTSRLTDMQNQGFELKPEDMTLYGQTSGNIARMFGSQGNQMSQDLASRGLASAPSGAAGAMFSGLEGNQNEMLAKAQQDIMQQRFQNTQNQITQQQGFINNLMGQNNAMGNLGASAINQQYTRQLQGANAQKGGLLDNAQANTGQIGADVKAGQFAAENKPATFGDALTGSLNIGGGAYMKTLGQGMGAKTVGADPAAAMG